MRAGGRLDAAEALGDLLERLVPGDRLEPLRRPSRRSRRSGRVRRASGSQKGAVVADRALAAELAAAHRDARIAADVPDGPVALDDRDAAGVVAVPRARRQHHLVHLRHASSICPPCGPSATPRRSHVPGVTCRGGGYTRPHGRRSGRPCLEGVRSDARQPSTGAHLERHCDPRRGRLGLRRPRARGADQRDLAHLRRPLLLRDRLPLLRPLHRQARPTRG